MFSRYDNNHYTTGGSHEDQHIYQPGNHVPFKCVVLNNINSFKKYNKNS